MKQTFIRKETTRKDKVRTPEPYHFFHKIGETLSYASKPKIGFDLLKVGMIIACIGIGDSKGVLAQDNKVADYKSRSGYTQEVKKQTPLSARIIDFRGTTIKIDDLSKIVNFMEKYGLKPKIMRWGTPSASIIADGHPYIYMAFK